jgi:hypothetical protein
MRIKYPKAIQESEEELTRLEQSLRGQKAADRVRVLRRLEKWNGEEFEGLCADGRLQCEPADALVGTLSGRGLGRSAQAAQASREAFAADPRGMGRLVASDASGTHCDHARRVHVSGARVGHQLQERQGARVALQETSSACGRPGADDTRRRMQSNRPPVKKLRQPGKATTAAAARGLR